MMKTSCVLMVVLGLALPAALASCPDGFVVFSNGACMKMVAHPPDFMAPPTLTWNEARTKCQALGADLATIEDIAILDHISQFIEKNVQDLLGRSILVGGRRENGLWRWLNGERISTSSNMWVPYAPSDENEGDYVSLVPADSSSNRLYLSQGTGYGATGYICQKY